MFLSLQQCFAWLNNSGFHNPEIQDVPIKAEGCKYCITSPSTSVLEVKLKK